MDLIDKYLMEKTINVEINNRYSDSNSVLLNLSHIRNKK